MARQHDTCIFRNFKWWFAIILMKKDEFWGVNRWEKDALVVDFADYDTSALRWVNEN